MTQTEFSAAVRRMFNQCRRDIEARVRAREEMGLVYVRKYTVKAHFRKHVPHPKRRRTH